MDEESIYSSEDYDPGMDAIQAQERIFQLKKERDQRINAVVVESEAALAALRSRVEAYHGQRRRQRAKVHAQYVTRILEMVEKRKEIEAKMQKVVTVAHSAMGEVEEMMLAGYQGREADASSSGDALAGDRE